MSPWVKVKGVLAVLGLALGLSGMGLESRLLVWIAVASLGAAFLVRFIEPRAPAPRSPDVDQPPMRE